MSLVWVHFDGEKRNFETILFRQLGEWVWEGMKPGEINMRSEIVRVCSHEPPISTVRGKIMKADNQLVPESEGTKNSSSQGPNSPKI